MPPLLYAQVRAVVLLVLFLIVAGQPVAAAESLDIRATIDLSSDVGQPLGTLWEAIDQDGTPVAGAGFVSAYNTYHRSDRRQVHVYVRTPSSDDSPLERLPRPGEMSGTYLLNYDGTLYADARGHGDGRLRRWQPDTETWVADPAALHRRVQIAGAELVATEGGIRYGEQIILELTPEEGVITEWYYAHGLLVIRRQNDRSESTASPAPDRVNELVGFAWAPGDDKTLALAEGHPLSLDPMREFIYAFGAGHDAVLAASNRGGVHLYDGQQWLTLRSPDGKSFQVYASLRVSDRLLVGQYPTGELFELDRQALTHLGGWPPVLDGVSSSAREAQTLALYGGDLYVGVWPWGEIWRRDLALDRWQFFRRVFSHPPLTDATTHPYEAETKAVGEVLNLWGQRVTSMVPVGDSLYISTSSKGGQPYDDRLAFLDGDQGKEYGAVYRYRRPGCLAAPLEFQDGPIEVRFRVTPTSIEVWQNDEKVARTEWAAEHAATLEKLRLRIGEGIFGPAGVAVTGKR